MNDFQILFVLVFIWVILRLFEYYIGDFEIKFIKSKRFFGDVNKEVK